MSLKIGNQKPRAATSFVCLGYAMYRIDEILEQWLSKICEGKQKSHLVFVYRDMRYSARMTWQDLSGYIIYVLSSWIAHRLFQMARAPVPFIPNRRLDGSLMITRMMRKNGGSALCCCSYFTCEPCREVGSANYTGTSTWFTVGFLPYVEFAWYVLWWILDSARHFQCLWSNWWERKTQQTRTHVSFTDHQSTPCGRQALLLESVVVNIVISVLLCWQSMLVIWKWVVGKPKMSFFDSVRNVVVDHVCVIPRDLNGKWSEGNTENRF